MLEPVEVLGFVVGFDDVDGEGVKDVPKMRRVCAAEVATRSCGEVCVSAIFAFSDEDCTNCRLDQLLARTFDEKSKTFYGSGILDFEIPCHIDRSTSSK